MKFLYKTSLNPNTPAPPEQVAVLLEQTIVLNDSDLRDGIADCYYFVAEGESIGIINADSIEDAWRIAMTNPFMPYCHTEVIALVDSRRVMRDYLEAIRRAQREPVGV